MKKHRKVDFRGKKIKLGSRVATASHFSGARSIWEGTIVRFTPSNLAVVKVDDKYKTSYLDETKREPRLLVLLDDE
jgi:hypothetical protein